MSTNPIVAELQEEVSNCSLSIEGKIPAWLSGTLIRNGPVTVTINGKSNAHWFDGLAMLHAFSFHQGDVNYSNQFLRSDAYHAVFDKGSLNYEGFAADPCRSLFKKFLTFFFPPTHPPIHNANVNVAKLADAYVALTEVPLPVKFDPQTLETLGVLNYRDELPHEKCWESAHPHRDGDQKEVLNYLIEFGRSCYYTPYRIEEGSNERKIIAKIAVATPSYMHSFAITEHYIIFTEFPLVVNPLDLLIKRQAFIKNFAWKPEQGTRFTVIDKRSGDLAGQSTTRSFFAFHHANAFESDQMVHLDIVTYPDATIITGKSLYTHTDDPSLKDCHPCLERFSLSLNTGEIQSEILFSQSSEFPRINEKHDGKPYQYVYLAGFNNATAAPESFLNSEGLYKVNTTTRKVLEWHQPGCCAGEPVFVASPHAQEEDDGVVLALVLDHSQNTSFLLILDGKNFQELGRAKTPHLIPAGLHSQYFQ